MRFEGNRIASEDYCRDTKELRTKLDEARESLKEVRSPRPIGPMCIWKRIDAWLEKTK